MKVFRFAVQEGFEWALPGNSADGDRLTKLAGAVRVGAWIPIRMSLLLEDEGKKLQPADTPWLGRHVLVLKQSAIDVLGDLLARDGEVLPLDCSETPLYLWNVVNVIDALDVERSEIVRFRSSDRIMRIERHVFRPDVLAGQLAFRIPGEQDHAIFLSDEFVLRASKHHLRGLGFRLLWQDE